MKDLKHLFTALLLLCTTMATAHEFEVGGIYYYILSMGDKTVEVTYYGTSYNSSYNEYAGSVVIPESVTYNGTTYSITSIGSGAFRGCTMLTSIEIPNSVTSIGSSAFRECTMLTSITIPNSVTSIGDYAFRDCSSLTSIVVDGNNTKYDSRENCNAIIETETNTLVLGCENTIIPNSVTSIERYAFYDCTGLTSIIIGNSVTSIGESAFYGCSGLTSITIPNSVTSIGNEAFNGCTSLKELRIEDGEGTLSLGHNTYDSHYTGKGLFYDCPLETLYLGRDLSYNTDRDYGCSPFYDIKTLASVTIGNSVTSIGSSAFYNCTGITSIVVDGNNTKYDSRENCNAIIETETNTLIAGCKNTIIPNSVTSIGSSAFYKCTGLTSIEIGNSVTSIGSSAFYKCTGLTSIEIGNSVTSIGSSAFSDCTGLTSITIPNSVTSIGDYAFYNCTGLTSIIIGNSVTSIGEEAFAYCTGITSITIPNSVTSIGHRAFYGCTGLTSITIPNSVTSIGYRAFYGTVWYNNQPDGVVYAGKVLYEYKGTMPSNTSITIKDGTLGIAVYAFDDCSGLTSITIPNSVTSIGGGAFYGCTGLTSITIPNSVTSIGSSAFYGCTGLKTVFNFSNLTFRKGSNSYGYVAYYADKVYNAPNGSIEGDFIFGKPNDVNTLLYYLGNATELTLPAGYNGENYAIGAAAFQNYTGLAAELIIHNNITGIGASAFDGCNNIEKLYIGCSVESIGDKAFAGCEKITEIKVALEKPIKGSDDIFANAVYDNATLYIPNGTEQLYQKREPWNIFFDIVEIDFTGIDEVLDEVKGEDGEVKTVYDLNGRVVENPSKGIYIINGKKCWLSESGD